MFSILILNYNTKKLTRECIRSIHRYTKNTDYEILVLDQGSSDGSPAILKRINNIQEHLLDKNLGFAGGHNYLMARCKGEYICLLNSDTIVCKDWLIQMKQKLDDGYGIVAPLQRNPITKEVRKHPIKKEMKYVSGFCMLFKRSLVDDIGTLDEQFEIGCGEDNDYCERARRAGYKLGIADKVIIDHYGQATFKANKISKSEIGLKNREKLHQKWAKN